MADVRTIEGVTDGDPTFSKAPIMDMARVLTQLLRDEARIDQLEVQSGGQQGQPVDLWRRTNLQAIDGAEQVIAAVPATELDEATVQILIAAGYANNLADEAWDVDLKDTAARLALLLRSALPVVARSAGVDLEEFRAEHYGQSTRDWPFHPVRAAGEGRPARRLEPVAATENGPAKAVSNAANDQAEAAVLTARRVAAAATNGIA
jgi:hypothetical protein